MTDEITFMDLASLLKITPNTPLEKLGSALNASIFDASNMAGTLKQKGLIEFTANYPGPNAITITEAGKTLIKEADDKSLMPSDALDDSILTQLSGGKRIPVELQNTLNIRPRDLAMRLYKLNKQNMMTYELKNGGVELLLTEQGFLRAKGGPIVQPPTQPTQVMPIQPQVPPVQPPIANTMGMQTTPGGQQSNPFAMPPIQGKKMAMPDMGRMLPIVAGVVVVIIVVVALYMLHII